VAPATGSPARFVTVPVQSDTGRYATSEKLVACLTNADNAFTTDTTLSYVAAADAVQTKQVAADAELGTWVQAVHAAKGRTSDNLGTKYPKISEQMWTAVQAALSGSANPAGALGTAQKSVSSAG